MACFQDIPDLPKRFLPILSHCPQALWMAKRSPCLIVNTFHYFLPIIFDIWLITLRSLPSLPPATSFLQRSILEPGEEALPLPLPRHIYVCPFSYTYSNLLSSNTANTTHNHNYTRSPTHTPNSSSMSKKTIPPNARILQSSFSPHK